MKEHRTNEKSLPFTSNLSLALKRIKKDQRDDWYPDPILYRDVTKNESQVKDYVDKCLVNFKSSKSELLNIPKPGFTLRYGMHEPFQERVIYQMMADHLVPFFEPLLDERVFSYRYDPDNKNYIFRHATQAWLQYRDLVRQACDRQYRFVLKTDVYNYYESIPIDMLYDVLLNSSSAFPNEVIKTLDLLRGLLKGWSPFNGYGIPQNRDTSAFLGNIYLHNVDKDMVEKGYRYFRYMDDVMIVCRDEFHARKALHDFVEQLRKYRLNVNSKKTAIISTSEEEFKYHFPESDKEMAQIDSLIRSGGKTLKRQALPRLEKLVTEVFFEEELDERKFRFCLYRIFNFSRSKIVHDWSSLNSMVIGLLKSKPWLTSEVMSYLRIAVLSDDQISEIISFLECEKKNIYSWQEFHIWSLLGELNQKNDNLLNLARARLRATESRIPVRAAAALFIGKNGNGQDRYNLARRLVKTESGFVKRMLLIALQESSSTVVDNYIKPNIDILSLNSFNNLRNMESGPIYYSPPSPLEHKDILADVPDIPS